MSTTDECIWIYRGQCIKIIDGDTVVIRTDLGFNVYRDQRFRLLRVNTPELRDPNPELRAKALEAKDALILMVLNKQVKVTSFKNKADKYGRYLCELEVAGQSVNDLLIQMGYKA